MRLIDADESIINFGFEWDDISPTRDEFVAFLKKQPTIDAVPVVRCEDCKFGDWDSEPDDAMVCMRTKDGFWRSGNDFCSFGKQKEGADNGC